ncbi:hypothetical protein KEM48_013616 [Puccinia striiformis f. sp. tritici PST-130]|nr:hypothetical protein H4Q26_014911 [Puccinia striiformis f. sp. tritici PST-130]KAI9630846.1 hypothetical protein KEM48_013616 [Puccinia striiformis f. sp. tritici PST-130]
MNIAAITPGPNQPDTETINHLLAFSLFYYKMNITMITRGCPQQRVIENPAFQQMSQDPQAASAEQNHKIFIC